MSLSLEERVARLEKLLCAVIPYDCTDPAIVEYVRQRYSQKLGRGIKLVETNKQGWKHLAYLEDTGDFETLADYPVLAIRDLYISYIEYHQDDDTVDD